MLRRPPARPRRAPHRPAHRGGDGGAALVAVLGTMAVVTSLLLGALAMVLHAQSPTRANQDAATAEAAAQAGLDEYIARLDANGTYWTTGNTDPANPALGPGRAVPGTGGAAGRYSYRLLDSPSDIAARGVLQLAVTGTSTAPGGRTASRTLIATLRVSGFLHYLYFSDVEATDPALFSSTAQATANGSSTTTVNGTTYSVRASSARVAADCSRKYYEGRRSSSYTATTSDPATLVRYDGSVAGTLPGFGGTPSGATTIADYCTRDIQFTTGDTINGPLHSNDAVLLAGSPLFASADTTVAWPGNTTGQYWWGSGAPSAGTTSQPGYAPTGGDPVAMPTGDAELLRYVQPKIDSDPNTDRPGCLYRGATRLRFSGSTVYVYSPNTTTTTPGCFDASQRTAEQAITPVPPVLYVAATTGSCTGVGYPLAGEDTTGTTTNYACTRGTAFVSGTLSGRTTVSGADDVVVTGDLTDSDNTTGTDVIGLVATNYVWVEHPVDGSGANLLATPVTKIDAAVLSLQHSFLVQNYDRGAPTGTLRVRGAIAQRFRGPVGTGSASGPASGYLKNYVYDPRLDALQPPYFLKPVSAPWRVQQVTDGQGP